MAWEQYVDSFLLGCEKGNGGAIVGYDGLVWSCFSNANFGLTQEEAKTLAKSAAGNIENLKTVDLIVGGKKFEITHVDTEKNCATAKHEDGGLSMYKTKKTLVIGFYANNNTTPEQNAEATYHCAKYMLDLDY
ncbi:profilin, putative [Entamoeba invadens IP1]|uniref:Profilin n=2 Tax=Entamoeba invadens TaxID=33085 RepID=A0A0A1TVW1_ENTIV|nr:profilin, putative [Entamoeba invadens IP1]ELP84576.1 profilin, putative [Entamoeba invadens IP1]BAK61678.1 profilin [Entamoeba invadens]|eukprot:XP_004183922.1 profilin, putative [Entamoeba invadens IP1]